MRLVKIGDVYINPERVDGICSEHVYGGSYETKIYCGGADEGFAVKGTVGEVVKALMEAGNDESGSH